MTLNVDPFDDAITRMHNATHAAHDAFLDADAALRISLQAMRDATAARGTLGQQLTDMRETIVQLQGMILQQGETFRQQGEELRQLRKELGR